MTKTYFMKNLLNCHSIFPISYENNLKDIHL